MDETAVRTLLRAIADTPEPPPAIDLDRARRRGLRRLRIRRAAAPALAVVVVVAALTVPSALQINRPERSAATPRPTVASPSLTAPDQFSPLVPYASFGWLPAGFSQSAANDIDSGEGITSATGFVSLEAADPAAGHLLSLQVNVRGADDGLAGTGDAPDVNGRPAVWVNYGDGIAWEYAPGAWASLTTSITPAADGPRSRRIAAERGWVLTPRTKADRLAVAGTVAQVEAAIREGRLIPPSLQTRALLVQVASHVRYAQTTPLEFPFRLTGQLPDGWQLTQASFIVSGSRLIGNAVTAGPAADPTALTFGGYTTPVTGGCNFVTGQSSYVTRLGLPWIYRVLDEADKHWESLCTQGPVDGLGGVTVSMDMNTPGSNAALPGSTQLGGVLGVLARLRFLGSNPPAWTSAPVG
jgi:hypothetical protein